MRKKEIDPYKRLPILILLAIPLIVYAAMGSQETELAAKNKVEYPGMAIIGGTTLMPIAEPAYKEIYELGELKETSTGLMDKIMDCESNDDPTAENPNSTAFGRCQMIEETRKYIERKWDLEIDWEDPEQQGYACERLLREEGIRHWEETRYCWGKGN